MSRPDPAKPKPWETVGRRVVFSSGPIREVAIETVRLPDDRIVPDYHVVTLPDYVLVYAQMVDGTIPLLRQYKHGLRRVCLAFPGGAIEGDESPLQAAQRELREELGAEAEEWEHLSSLVTNANQRCNVAHLFRAHRVRTVDVPRSGDLEEAAIEYFDRASLRQRVRVDEIGQASHVALLFLGGDV